MAIQTGRLRPVARRPLWSGLPGTGWAVALGPAPVIKGFGTGDFASMRGGLSGGEARFTNPADRGRLDSALARRSGIV